MIEERIRHIAPDNRALQPIALSYESDTWYVYLTIDRPGDTEVTIDTSANSVRVALATAWRHLCNYEHIRPRARALNERLEVTSGRASFASA